MVCALLLEDSSCSVCYRRCVEEESFNFTYHSVAFSDLQPVREILDDFQKKFCEGMCESVNSPAN